MATQETWKKKQETSELAEMLKALAHSSRISIMFLLCNQKQQRMKVKHIYEELKMSQPVISRHLGILRNSGLLRRFNEGSTTLYELNKENKLARKIAACFSTM